MAEIRTRLEKATKPGKVEVSIPRDATARDLGPTLAKLRSRIALERSALEKRRAAIQELATRPEAAPRE